MIERKSTMAALCAISLCIISYPVFIIAQIDRSDKQEPLVTGPSALYESDQIFFEVPTDQDLADALLRDTRSRDQVRSFLAAETEDSQIADLIIDESMRYEIPVLLAFSLSWTESRFDPKAVNWNSASVDRGLFQLNSRSFPHLTEAQFFDPETNVREGVKYLKQCLDVAGNEVAALAMYNAGRRRVTETGAPRSTLDYIHRIQSYHQGLQGQLEEMFPQALTVHGKNPDSVRYVTLRSSGVRVDS